MPLICTGERKTQRSQIMKNKRVNNDEKDQFGETTGEEKRERKTAKREKRGRSVCFLPLSPLSSPLILLSVKRRAEFSRLISIFQRRKVVSRLGERRPIVREICNPGLWFLSSLLFLGPPFRFLRLRSNESHVFERQIQTQSK